jgi:hypothetical protein
MKSESLDKYVYFGTCLRYLQDASIQMPVKKQGTALYNIKHFLSKLEELELNVTRNLSKTYELTQLENDLEKVQDDANLSSDEAMKLTSLITSIRDTLMAEISAREAFVVTPKRIDTTKLIKDVSLLLRPGVFIELPSVAQYDIGEAGKSIAFERPTAAAFHLLRATESVLRHFYCTLIRQKRVHNLLWHDMVEDLRNRRKTEKYSMLYNNLDNIRFHYRNPTQHPDKIYDIEEVQDLWSLCIEVINRMITVLQESK